MSTVSDKVRFINKVFGTGVLGSGGVNIAVCCPNPRCGSYGVPSKKKLVIKVDSDMFQCWVCDLKGRSLSPILKKYFPAYVSEYNSKFSKTIHVEKSDNSENEIVVPPPGFKLLAINLAAKDPDVKDTIKYARSRGLNNRDFWYFKLGTCTKGKFRRRFSLDVLHF